MKEKKIFKKWNKLTPFGLLGVFLFVKFLIPHQAYAASVKSVIISSINWILLAIRSILVSGIMKLAAWLTAASLSLNQTLSANIADPTNFVYVGWGIFRDLANLGFVFGIILIAIATILRMRSYQAQSILWKLIVAALIVNFSLVICGAILKVSDVFSNFFLQSITQNQNIADRNNPNQVSGAVALKITDNTQFASIISSDSGVGKITLDNTKDQSSVQFSSIISTFIQIIMAVFISFVLLVLAVMFLLRYFNLAFLMILVPGVWLLWIFPVAYRYWREWWQHFIRWTFFAPLMLLFIYLAVKAMELSRISFETMSTEISDSGGGGGVTGFSSIMLSLMGGAILIGGLKVSQKMGMAGSSFILKQATKARGWAQAKATRGAARVANRVAKPVLQGAGRGLATFAGKTGFVGRWTAGMAGRGMIKAGAAIEKEAGGTFKETKEEFGRLYGQSKERLLGILPSLSGQKKMAALALLDEKGWLQDAINENPDLVREVAGYSELSEKVGVKKEFASVARRGKSIGEVRSARENLRSLSGLKPDDKTRMAAEATLRSAQLELDKQYSGDEWKSQGEAYFPRTLSGGRTKDQTLDPNSMTNPDLAVASHTSINAARTLNSESDQDFLSATNKISTKEQALDLADSMMIAAFQQDPSVLPKSGDIFTEVQTARTALIKSSDPTGYINLMKRFAASPNNLHKKVAKRIQETQLSTHVFQP
jgi:hypothetical protein